MLWDELTNPLVIILGPTASGKTKLAVDLAVRIQSAEIVSADSRLVYRGMNIGTAKPTFEERHGIPHHLIDTVNPDEIWSLAEFKERVVIEICEIQQRRKLPILVGGTGQYLRAILEDWQPPSQSPIPRLRSILETWASKLGGEELHRGLKILDPDAAEKIDFHNVRRIIRALEVIFSTGERFSSQRKKGVCSYTRLLLGIRMPREILFRRIDARIEHMIKEGFLEEVQMLLNLGYSKDMPSFSAIGYPEMISLIQGKISMETAKIEMKRKTRKFVRKQANWFKENNPEIHWLDESADMVSVALTKINDINAWKLPDFGYLNE